MSSVTTLYWRVIALQCCIGFCCTTLLISYKYTFISSLLNSLLPTPNDLSKSLQSMELSSLCYAAASSLFYKGAWWAAVYGVTQSRTRLKLLSSSSSIFWKYSFLKKHISCSNCVAISYVQIAHYFLLYVDGLYTFSRPLQTLGFYGFKAMKSKASLPR